MQTPEKKKKEQENQIENQEMSLVPYRHDIHDILNKSNKYIRAKYKATTLEHQVTYLAMLKVQEKQYYEEDGEVVVALNASEIKSETGVTGGSFYEGLKRVADDMTANNMGIIDDENERFAFISLVSMATYENGVLKIYFPKRLKESLINVVNEKKGFTGLPKHVAMKLKKPCSFPLYQFLKSVCYYPATFTGRRDNVFEYQIGLSELKLTMGVVNSNLPDVRNILNNSKGTEADYDKAVAKSPDKMYNVWSKFNVQCLRPTVDEINEKSDIYVEYEPKTKGKGGKTHAVLFRVYINGAENHIGEPVPVSLDKEGEIHVSLTDADKFTIALEVGNILSELGLQYSDILSICEAANYSKEDIIKAYDTLKTQGGSIKNVVGWIISAIKNNYSSTAAEIKSETTEKKRNSFMNFHQREYDTDELEKMLLS